MEQKIINDDSDSRSKTEDIEKDAESGWVGSLIFIVLVAVSIWVLVHFNPSKSMHQEKINEVMKQQVAEMIFEGYSPDYLQIGKLGNAEYHSLGICSWTTIRQGGRPAICSIGILGWVCPLF